MKKNKLYFVMSNLAGLIVILQVLGRDYVPEEGKLPWPLFAYAFITSAFLGLFCYTGLQERAKEERTSIKLQFLNALKRVTYYLLLPAIGLTVLLLTFMMLIGTFPGQ